MTPAQDGGIVRAVKPVDTLQPLDVTHDSGLRSSCASTQLVDTLLAQHLSEGPHDLKSLQSETHKRESGIWAIVCVWDDQALQID